MIRISIPKYRKIRDESGEYTVFEIRVARPGGQAMVERRYSEFSKFNKKLREIIEPPTLPPKTILNKSSRLLEARREGLEYYLQNLIGIYEVYGLLGEFLDMVLPTATPSRSRTSSIDDVDAEVDYVSQPTHQNLLLFTKDLVMEYFGNGENGCMDRNSLPDTVIKGVLDGLYGDQRTAR
ncbi:predicted protein [Nematostella vectensis]|uniref:PX domain-containing protein n=1 Tax=Nematostella vectensis TaxID=45351 RepID=A7RR59_NEMVE|nr:sorting nexin-24 [Nematostella vectensis]EDO46056.1 predicted protein [Nematostella vectensis]|eukprot:XP_001638119.1 predicted protein [Nematostella vectensis]